jgi:hypothetical protein
VTELPAFGDGPRTISPTDLTQYIRLDQCQRCLRLRLHERAHGLRFLYDYDVRPQAISPLLTLSGAAFERRVEAAIGQRFATQSFAAGKRRDPQTNDNDAVVRLARELAPGDTLVLAQPRLFVTLGRWRMRGDIDLLRLERDAVGALHLLIADMKSSPAARVEHRLQVACYLAMLEALLAEAGVPFASLRMGVLYRGPAEGIAALTEAERARQAAEAATALDLFNVPDALLEIVEDVEAYRGSVRDLVTDENSVAERVARAPFDALFFHLTQKCDGCLYSEFCMKRSAERDDLSLLPHLTPEEKTALQRAGLTTTRAVATLKELPLQADGTPSTELVTPPGQEPLVRQLAASWPVGPHLDELIHRARRYRRLKGDPIRALSYIPSNGYGSLPYCDAQHNPNLVRIYLDAQHDYLQDRIYLLGALVSAAEGGVETPQRRRSIVHLSDGPPESPAQERALFIGFARALLRAVVEVAAPDEAGEARAPIHLIFYDHFGQQRLLEGLARHLGSILEATPLYDFVTQLAAFDSPIISFLDQEIREQKNYPMLCQSLQAVASYLKFDWNAPEPYRERFHTRLFDYWSKFAEAPQGREAESRWYTGRARFSSQIPLEYAYAAWGELPRPAPGRRDDYAPYRAATPALLRGFQARRLEAMEQIARDFPGNRQTQKRSFALPDLAQFDGAAQTLAQALDEFLTIERHTDLAAWKAARLAAPERRVLAGETLIVEYREADQAPGVAEQNRENRRRWELAERWRAGAPDGQLTAEQRQATKWSQKDLRVRLRLCCEGVDCGLDEALSLTALREGEGVVVMPRWTVDSRPGADPAPFTPTVRQLLRATRADLGAITVERDTAGNAVQAFVELRLREANAPRDARGFAFTPFPRPFEDGERYTLDPDPTDWYGYFCLRVVDGLRAGKHNVLYERLTADTRPPLPWPDEAVAAQCRFLDGLVALRRAGALHDFEPSKQEYIGRHGEAPLLLVQGPPGTGKSYTTAFAIFARMQGALAAGRAFRAFVCCKTHAATDVLLQNVAQVQARLRELREREPAIFAAYFDARLLDAPLYRLQRPAPAPGVVSLPQNSERTPGQPTAIAVLNDQPHCVVGTTPGGVYRLLQDTGKGLFGHALCDCLVLDEASQMNLPEALMAALALRDEAQVVIVGDHRQMPPIVKHDWGGEPRRTFQQFRAYESLFRTLLPLDLPLIQFQESFRLHADMAEFLRREVYQQDGIAYFSRRDQTLPPCPQADPFLAAVLRPEQTIVVVVHDEDESMLRNRFEQALLAEILTALAAPPYALDAEQGLGVVVPHRAQRAALQTAVPQLNVLDPRTGRVVRSAVDTVERFQGDERAAILVGATESNPQYLLVSSEFLLDPRRLTVALSRAKEKLILVAARSVFALFSTDAETFAHAQLWKNLLRRTCTVPLWRGERDGHTVEVWGNRPGVEERQGG